MRLTLPTGSTVADVIDTLNIPKEYAGMLVIGDVYVEKETQLTDGVQLSIFPPLAGGALRPHSDLTGDHGR